MSAAAVNPATAFARTAVDELWRCGVREAVLAPGSRSAPLAMALHDDARIRLHVEIDERSAGFLALGLARGSGRPAVVLTTSGSAVANLLPAVVEADASCVPLLLLTSDRPLELQDTGANQTMAQPSVFGAFVRSVTHVAALEYHVDAARYWRSLVSRAVGRARGAGEVTPGPVQVNVGFREPLVPENGPVVEPQDGRADDAPWTATRPARRMPDPGDVAWLRTLTGRRGVVVLGDGADPEPLLRFASSARWPVLAEPLSGGRRPGTIGCYDLLLRHEPFARAHRPEVAVLSGRIAVSKSLRLWLDDTVEQVLVAPDGRWIDPDRRAARVVVADAAALVDALPAGAVASPPSWLEAWVDADRRARIALDAFLDADSTVNELRTARDLAAALPDGGTLVVASSMPVRDLDMTMSPRDGLRVVANRGLSGIDGFVSTALGVALTSDGPVAALAGDLSLLHDQNGLLLRDRPDLPIVVVNNDGGGIFSFLPQSRFTEGFERVFATPHGVDFSAFAVAHRCGHATVDAADDLGPAVAQAWDRGGVHLLEVRTDRAENVTLHRRLVGTISDILD